MGTETKNLFLPSATDSGAKGEKMSETAKNQIHVYLYKVLWFCDCIQVTLTQVRGQIVKERGGRSSSVLLPQTCLHVGAAGIPVAYLHNVPFQLLNMWAPALSWRILLTAKYLSTMVLHTMWGHIEGCRLCSKNTWRGPRVTGTVGCVHSRCPSLNT